MPLSAALLLIAAFIAMLVGRLQPAPGRGPVPWLTLAIVAALALAGAAQWAWPTLLFHFERNACAIMGGEVYRLFTALWFQDGGLAGGGFNLVMALLVGSLAERLWNRRGWLLLYFGAGLAGEGVGLWWQPIGAGNSIAWMGLAGGMLVSNWAAVRFDAVTVLRAIGLGAGVALAVERDIHGAALLIGAAIGLVLIRIGHGLRARAEPPAPLA